MRVKVLRSASGGDGFRFTRVIGTGGIGSGILFQLADAHTLGRNESRLGELTGNWDYCKLHIICHYPAVLLGDGIDLYPIGKLGKDAEGYALLAQLEDTGMSAAYVDMVEDARTLFSVCFQYPDLSGGNITTSNSASGLVTASDIGRALAGLPPAAGGELMLAAPEVPLEARIALLAEGRARGSFNVASALASEADAFRRLGGCGLTDLLAVNREEARCIAGLDETCEDGGREIAERCYELLRAEQPDIRLIMTDGADGCYSYAAGIGVHTPALRVAAVSTAGAGDALLGGVISGLCCGLPLMKERADAVFGETPLSSAVELGVLLAALAVTSPHSIHLDADAGLLGQFASEHGLGLDAAFHRMLLHEEQVEEESGSGL
ncbi:sugar/nucleoside kinase (ribokinase family) [Paenibacillus taihuensis]|uniref:Sugar/nucleoside kinase (Ribokinase family) n=1 Tax=Paenibacillus taihuensis TaxID=1156355 RepID=A0A3D9S3X9_9BACL|nr:PfkB family carbohydrate kinase [Paenibacillus taihuensis]REE87362.1 sugar/nucleoside kinase (ribokinase family) [Paenibacillus taihuensis]